MKIAYLYTELTISGGTDRVLTDKANYLAEHGYDITIITESQMGRPIVFPLSPKVKWWTWGSISISNMNTISCCVRLSTLNVYNNIKFG